MKTLQKVEKQKRNEELYHPISSTTHQRRIENKRAFEKWIVEKEPTFFITFVFNRKFSNPNVEQIIKYGEEKLRKFHKYLHKKLLGKYWYKPEIIHPTEHIEMWLFPQKVLGHLHYHGGVVVKNTKMFPNKVEMFLEHSNHIWKLNRELCGENVWSYSKMNKYLRENKITPTRQQQMEIKKLIQREVIVPNGEVDIQTPDSIDRVSNYSTREQDRYDYYEHYYISGSQ